MKIQLSHCEHKDNENVSSSSRLDVQPGRGPPGETHHLGCPLRLQLALALSLRRQSDSGKCRSGLW